jgi:hypothetical protein
MKINRLKMQIDERKIKLFLGQFLLQKIVRVRDVNFPARQLVSGTMAQPSA